MLTEHRSAQVSRSTKFHRTSFLSIMRPTSFVLIFRLLVKRIAYLTNFHRVSYLLHTQSMCNHLAKEKRTKLAIFKQTCLVWSPLHLKWLAMRLLSSPLLSNNTFHAHNSHKRNSLNASYHQCEFVQFVASRMCALMKTQWCDDPISLYAYHSLSSHHFGRRWNSTIVYCLGPHCWLLRPTVTLWMSTTMKWIFSWR